MSLSNHIEEYFAHQEGNKEVLIAKELFQAKQDDVDIKTELKMDEIVLINSMMWNNDLLERKGLKKHYNSFIWHYMRLKISFERKSRGEFVNMNKGNNVDDMIGGVANLNSLAKSKK